MPSHHLSELIAALEIQVGKPPFKRPPEELRRECDSEGLDQKDFTNLLEAITKSKHGLLVGRSIRLLIPRRKLTANVVSKIVAGFSQTDSSFVRQNWARYLCTCFHADIFSVDGMDCLR